MNGEGDYPGVPCTNGDAIAGDRTVPDGRPLTIEESNKSALGCD